MAEMKARAVTGTTKRATSRVSASKSTSSKTVAAKPQTAMKSNVAKTAVSQRKPVAAQTRNEISHDVRQIMIAEAAYYRSERRGFLKGYEEEDWLQAECEVDNSLNGPSPSSA